MPKYKWAWHFEFGIKLSRKITMPKLFDIDAINSKCQIYNYNLALIFNAKLKFIIFINFSDGIFDLKFWHKVPMPKLFGIDTINSKCQINNSYLALIF